jgi:hypothetical protein
MFVFSFRFGGIVRWGTEHSSVFDFHCFLVPLVFSSCFAGDTARLGGADTGLSSILDNGEICIVGCV